MHVYLMRHWAVPCFLSLVVLPCSPMLTEKFLLLACRVVHSSEQAAAAAQREEEAQQRAQQAEAAAAEVQQKNASLRDSLSEMAAAEAELKRQLADAQVGFSTLAARADELKEKTSANGSAFGTTIAVQGGCLPPGVAQERLSECAAKLKQQEHRGRQLEDQLGIRDEHISLMQAGAAGLGFCQRNR